jgi:chemotaxis protein CheX
MTLSPKLLERLQLSEEELVKLVIKDVREIFTTMVGMEDLMHLPLQVDPVNHFSDSISGMVGLGGACNGLVSIHLPRPLAIKVASSMLAMELEEVNADVRDALGEIANMIAGSFKLHLTNGGSNVHLSTPSVITGNEYIISVGNAKDIMTLLFDTDEEWLMVAIALKND